MEGFPKEIWANTFKYLDYDDVIKQCKLKASTRSICERQEFWQWWLNERYKLNLNDDKLDYRDLAAKSNYILRGMEKSDIILTIRSFKFILLNMSKPDIDNIFSVPELHRGVGRISTIEGLIYFADLEEKYNPEIFNSDINFNLEEGDNTFYDYDFANITANLTDIGKRNYKKIMDKVMVPTTYINSDGKLKTIEFNADNARSALTQSSNVEHFNDLLWNNLLSIENAFDYKYFTSLEDL